MQEILDAYRKGDMCQRANLFMGYRDLREEFMQIETDESEAAEKAQLNIEKPYRSLRRCCTLLANFKALW